MWRRLGQPTLPAVRAGGGGGIRTHGGVEQPPARRHDASSTLITSSKSPGVEPVTTKRPVLSGETVISRGWFGLSSTLNLSSFDRKRRTRSVDVMRSVTSSPRFNVISFGETTDW